MSDEMSNCFVALWPDRCKEESGVPTMWIDRAGFEDEQKVRSWILETARACEASL